MTDGYHDCRSRHDLPVGWNVGESTFRGDDMMNPNSSQFGHSFNTIQPTNKNQVPNSTKNSPNMRIQRFTMVIHLHLDFDPAKYG